MFEQRKYILWRIRYEQPRRGCNQHCRETGADQRLQRVQQSGRRDEVDPEDILPSARAGRKSGGMHQREQRAVGAGSHDGLQRGLGAEVAGHCGDHFGPIVGELAGNLIQCVFAEFAQHQRIAVRQSAGADPPHASTGARDNRDRPARGYLVGHSVRSPVRIRAILSPLILSWATIALNYDRPEHNRSSLRHRIASPVATVTATRTY